MDQDEGRLEEFRCLRAEIANTQQQRTAVLGFSVAAVGVIGSVVGNTIISISAGSEDAVFLAAIVLFLGYVTMTVALFMTAGYTQSIDHLATYVRRFLEPNLPGVNWETAWYKGRFVKGTYKRFGISKAYALSYGTLVIALTLVGACLVTSAGRFEAVFWLPLSALVVSLFLSVDLWFRWRRSWRSCIEDWPLEDVGNPAQEDVSQAK